MCDIYAVHPLFVNDAAGGADFPLAARSQVSFDVSGGGGYRKGDTKLF